MATLDRSFSSAPARTDAYAEGGVRFDLIAALLGLWLIVGLFVDGTAHNHGQVDNTFFTPWHALLYSSVLANGVYLTVHQFRGVARGHRFMRALPQGYLLSLVGVILFFVGGGFDFAWHEVFGFEANIEALMSPAHMLLALSGTLIVTGPLRAAWSRRGEQTGWRDLFPALISVLLFMSLLTFFLQPMNFFAQAEDLPGRDISGRYMSNLFSISGIASYVVTNAVMLGLVLFAARRWTLPFGAVTFLFTVNALAMTALEFQDTRRFWLAVVAAPLAGLIGDLLLRAASRAGRRAPHAWGIRAFAFLTPLALSVAHLVIVMRIEPILWTIHMWLGTSFYAAVAGLFISYLVFPPAPAGDAVEA